MRLDVYVETDKGSFDIELQAQPQDLGRRLRYYQASIDSHLLDKGDEYDRLPETFIVFVCDFDAFGFNKAKYSFETSCIEESKAHLDSGFHWVILNAKAASEASSKGLKALLKYIASGHITSDDELISKIDYEVDQANRDTRWVSKVGPGMSLIEDAEYQGFLQGRAEGRTEGEKRYGTLVAMLLSENRLSDLQASTEDETLLEQLYKEFNL